MSDEPIRGKVQFDLDAFARRRIKQLPHPPSWARMLIAVVLLVVLTNLPDVPAWLWYGKRAAAFAIFLWAAYEVVLVWREFNRVRKEPEQAERYYIGIRLSWPMVAAAGFGLICVLLLVTQLLGAR